MSDLIRRQEAIDAIHKDFDEICVWDESGQATANAVENILYEVPSAEPERKGMMTNHEVACLLADLFDDPCACNYNGIDEWLPFKCELQDACPNPVGVACWEQFLKWRGDR